ncbi:MAG: PIN domain-containing protein [Ruminococcus flavefaciens]|nr:PIN domain-containing protein [Ruminococcus flavefaciens]
MEETKENSEKFYIVDYPSVKQDGLDGIENLTSNDRAVIFYKGKENIMELSFVEKVHSSKAKIKFRNISESDDFGYILSAYAGYIIGIDPDTNLCIVSSEDRYNSLNNFCPNEKFSICVQGSISGKVPEKNAELTIIEEKITEEVVEEKTSYNKIEQALKPFNLTESSISYLIELINNSRKKYPKNREYRCNHVYKRMNDLPDSYKDKIFFKIKPYI